MAGIVVAAPSMFAINPYQQQPVMMASSALVHGSSVGGTTVATKEVERKSHCKKSTSYNKTVMAVDTDETLRDGEGVDERKADFLKLFGLRKFDSDCVETTKSVEKRRYIGSWMNHVSVCDWVTSQNALLKKDTPAGKHRRHRKQRKAHRSATSRKPIQPSANLGDTKELTESSTMNSNDLTLSSNNCTKLAQVDMIADAQNPSGCGLDTTHDSDHRANGFDDATVNSPDHGVMLPSDEAEQQREADTKKTVLLPGGDSSIDCDRIAEDILTCVRCRYTTSSSLKYDQHIRAHAGRYICKACGKACIKASDLFRHWSTHGIRSSTNGHFACDSCKFTAPQRRAVEHHMRLHYVRMPMGQHSLSSRSASSSRCGLCGKLVPRVRLFEHKRRVHGGCFTAKQQSAICSGRKMDTNGNAVALTAKRFRCRLCMQRFATPSHLLRHQLARHRCDGFAAVSCTGDTTDVLKQIGSMVVKCEAALGVVAGCDLPVIHGSKPTDELP
jgi:hypothetical protein